ncbi:helix-turn-helix domain-containing protein [Actinomadura graeca]|uniref:Helix-turn-helix domain-containing protein n=1 Tax=Actinomadura graeca TaxID=2750812 RepID=A0ABX8QPP2_9ACTN|nr:helix-turn-helix domain-containing protein [Actinomadura graeca]QXJ20583.1 helix-turn-helix domain-containing protein [Actinomadura graeca]
MDDHTVAGRVVAVLDAVALHRDPVTLAELTREVGIPKPTVRRIAADLVARRMLQRCPDGRYRLGAHLLHLGTRAAVQHGLLQAATPYVQDLFARSGEIVWVCTANDTAVTFMASAFGANRAPDVRRSTWPRDLGSAALQSSALGRVLLAERPGLLETLRGRPPAPQTPHAVTSWPRFLAGIKAVRDTAVAVEHQQCALGFSCVATALRGPDGSLIGCIGITGHTGSLPAERLGRPLLAAARDIGRCARTLHEEPGFHAPQDGTGVVPFRYG